MEAFTALIEQAEKAQKEKVLKEDKRPVLSTKLDAAKKEVKNKRRIAANVQSYLDRISHERDEKSKHDAERVDELLSMRRADVKSHRTMRTMLQRTKSANKAVIAEAVSLTDTADSLMGRDQCDQDDYGYESKVADAFFDSIVNRHYKNTPTSSSPPVPVERSTSSTVVSAAKHCSSSSAPLTASSSQKESLRPIEDQQRSIGKPKHKMTKGEMIAHAAKMRRLQQQDLKKAYKPSETTSTVVIDDVLSSSRPMSKRERDLYLQEEASRRRKLALGSKSSSASVNNTTSVATTPPTSSSKSSSVGQQQRIPPANLATKPSLPSQKSAKVVGASLTKLPSVQQKPPPSFTSSKPSNAKEKTVGNTSRHHQQQVVESGSDDEYSDEYEDEDDMSDFIDDSNDKVNISAQIRSIFGYDRRKFKDEEPFDDRAMENNKFSSVMQEEARSARIGLQEDLEDIAREEAEKKAKKSAALKKIKGGGKKR